MDARGVADVPNRSDNRDLRRFDMKAFPLVVTVSILLAAGASWASTQVSVIPLDRRQWVATPLISPTAKESPTLKEKDSIWELHSNHASFGFGYVLPSKVSTGSDTRLNWNWKVEKFPEGKEGDSAIRVGALITDSKTATTYPEGLKKLTEKIGAPTSYIVLYGAVRTVKEDQKCTVSPLYDHLVYCSRPAEANFLRQNAYPKEDLATTLSLTPTQTADLRVTGLWVMADVENSKSATEASIQNLILESSVKDGSRRLKRVP